MRHMPGPSEPTHFSIYKADLSVIFHPSSQWRFLDARIRSVRSRGSERSEDDSARDVGPLFLPCYPGPLETVPCESLAFPLRFALLNSRYVKLPMLLHAFHCSSWVVGFGSLHLRGIAPHARATGPGRSPSCNEDQGGGASCALRLSNSEADKFEIGNILLAVCCTPSVWGSQARPPPPGWPSGKPTMIRYRETSMKNICCRNSSKKGPSATPAPPGISSLPRSPKWPCGSLAKHFSTLE